MNADKKRASDPESDPCSSVSIRGSSSIFFRRGTSKPLSSLKIDKERLAGDPRYPFGIPRTDNGNYFWIRHFHSALNKKGRAGFVMANSAADARASEQEIREKIIRAGS
jgi:type I restriction enzyme M protein